MKRKTPFTRIVLLVLSLSCAHSLWAARTAGPTQDVFPVAINAPEGVISFSVCSNCSHRNFDNRKTYYWFKSREVHFSQGGAGGSLLHGEMKGYYPTRQLSYQGSFDEGLKTGTWKFWHPNGMLSRIERWKDGSLNGRVAVYDSTGTLVSETRYLKGEARIRKGNNRKTETIDTVSQNKKAMKQMVRQARKISQSESEPPTKEDTPQTTPEKKKKSRSANSDPKNGKAKEQTKEDETKPELENPENLNPIKRKKSKPSEKPKGGTP
jgi:hypothetical protein